MASQNFIARPALAVYNTGGGAVTGDLYLLVGGQQSSHGQPGVFLFDPNGNETVIPAVGFNSQYGTAVSISPTVAAVGSPTYNSSRGIIYVYTLDGNLSFTIETSDAVRSSLFSASVSVGSGKIVGGAPTDGIGSTYIYDIDGTNEIKITPTNNTLVDDFGRRVHIGQNKIFVGAPLTDAGGFSDAGVVFAYDLNGQNEVRLEPSDAGGRFGSSIATSDSLLVVGAPTSAYSSVTSVYVYDTNLSNEIKITPSDAPSNSEFGWSVAIGNDKIAVGARKKSVGGAITGGAYLYDLDGTNEIIIEAADGEFNDNFGSSVTIANNKLYIGAMADDDNGTNAGAVYVYNLDGTFDSKLTSGGVSVGFGVDISSVVVPA